MQNLPEGIMGAHASDDVAAAGPSVILYEMEPSCADGAARLDRLLSLAQEHAVQRVFLLSHADVFPCGRRVQESDAVAPQTRLGRRLCHLEALAASWREQERMAITIVRLPELYGPGQRAGEGLLGRILNAILERHVSTVSVRGEQAFLSARDAAYGLWQCVAVRTQAPVVHLGPGVSLSWQDFLSRVRPVLPAGAAWPTVREKHPDEGQADRDILFGSAAFSGTLARRELGWTAHERDGSGLRSVAEGMVSAYTIVQQQRREQEKCSRWRHWFQQAVPFLENVAGAGIMAGFAWWQQRYGFSSPFDFNYLYIGAMGLLYGKTQAIIEGARSLLLVLQTGALSAEELDRRLEHCVRADDFIGVQEDGSYAVLLAEADAETGRIVQKRLAGVDVPVVRVQEVD